MAVKCNLPQPKLNKHTQTQKTTHTHTHKPNQQTHRTENKNPSSYKNLQSLCSFMEYMFGSDRKILFILTSTMLKL